MDQPVKAFAVKPSEFDLQDSHARRRELTPRICSVS